MFFINKKKLKLKTSDKRLKGCMEQISKKLIEEIKRGNLGAFRFFYDISFDYIYAISKKVLKNDEDANEAVQETFIKIYRKIKTFKDDVTIKVWIYKIAFNTSLDIYRKRTGYVAKIKLFIDHFLGEKEEEESTKVIKKEIVTNLLNKLSDQEKNILILSSVEGLTNQEISNILNINVNTVKTKIKRIKDKLEGGAKSNEELLY